ncbi:hypothetical protein CLU79DRAFT_834054 [Phycomyces nitens]|nr:hypothetical protein CLU79DRAFT_834054 [Phycomyces nitens]
MLSTRIIPRPLSSCLFQTLRQITTYPETRPIRVKPKQILEQEGLGDVMIPGQYLRFFKPKKIRSRQIDSGPATGNLDQIYTQSARPLAANEFDSTPTISQERMADRIHRAIITMYSAESLPSLVTTNSLTIQSVKVSRNQRKCHVYYDPISTVKTERGNVHRALQKHASLLNLLARSYAQLRRPMSIKFVPDRQTKELDDIFNRLEAELESEK